MAQVVERWVPQARKRVDLFGFIDIIAIDGDGNTYGIQATSGDHVSDRVTKIQTECLPEFARTVMARWHIEVWGWSKQGARGKRKVWTLRRVAL